MNAPLDIIMAYALVTGTSLFTLVGTNVAKRLLSNTYKHAGAAIVINGNALTSDYFGGIQDDVYTFKCYGGTDDPDDAAEVGRAVFDRFQNVTADTASNGGIVMAHLLTSLDSIDPDEGWPVHIARYEIKTS